MKSNRKEMDSIIQLKNVYKTYQSRSVEFNALNNISLRIDKGKNIAVIGKSGSGKSTLLNLVSGIDRASSGEIDICGKKINAFSELELTKWRGANVGIVFQFFQLLPTLSVINNLLLPMDFLSLIPRQKRTSKAL